MEKYYKLYLQYLKTELAYSKHTIKSYSMDLRGFIEYLYKSGITLENLEYEVLLSYIAKLSYSLDRRSIARKLSAIKSFLKFLFFEGFKTEHIYSRIHYGKLPKRLMFAISTEDVDKLLAEIKGDSILDIRNRLIVELLFASGIRVSELVNINLDDINLNTKQIKILGKGQKFRTVYFNTVAEGYLVEYLKKRKEFLLLKHVEEHGFLMINRFAKPLTTRSVERIFNKLSQLANLETKPTPHTLRHSFATSLLNNGADIKVVKELLGHASISTTEKYTHISLEQLKKVYNKAHPRGTDGEDNSS